MRIWSAACSTGQEPYSLALTVLRLSPNAANLDVRVLATDIDTTVLEQARKGRYDSDALAMIPLELRSRWFERTGPDWQAGEAMRRNGDVPAIEPDRRVAHARAVRRHHVPQCRDLLWRGDAGGDLESLHANDRARAATSISAIPERVSGPAMSSYVSAGITTYQRKTGA